MLQIQTLLGYASPTIKTHTLSSSPAEHASYQHFQLSFSSHRRRCPYGLIIGCATALDITLTRPAIRQPSRAARSASVSPRSNRPGRATRLAAPVCRRTRSSLHSLRNSLHNSLRSERLSASCCATPRPIAIDPRLRVWRANSQGTDASTLVVVYAASMPN